MSESYLTEHLEVMVHYLPSWIATAEGLLATIPPSQYSSPLIKTGLKSVGAAAVARRAAF